MITDHVTRGRHLNAVLFQWVVQDWTVGFPYITVVDATEIIVITLIDHAPIFALCENYGW